jgi:D-alanyl-D-alanine carboxypeptidase
MIKRLYFSFYILFTIFPIVILAQTQDIKFEKLKEQFRLLEKENNLSGVILIAKDGKTILNEAYGFSNLADKIPNKLDTKFNLASMNKMFTAIAIMQLMEKGKISLQDNVGKYLTDYPNKTVADSVTIHHLLTHTSGMSNFWEEYFQMPKEKFKDVADYLSLFVKKDLVFKPGSKTLYSNSGYMVLGLIIEKVSGINYFDYVKEYIYRPTNMLNTDAYELFDVVPNLATGYVMSTEKPGQWTNNIGLSLAKGTPAGGGYSTADDLMKFSNALQNSKLLNKENTDLCTKGKVKYRDGLYGYGFLDEIVNGHRIIGHSGGHVGIANEFMIYTDLGYTVIILTNGDVENFWEVSNLIKSQLVGSTPSTDNHFYTRDIIKRISKEGYESVIKESEKDPKKSSIRESLIERYGYRLLFEKKFKQAIELFTFNLNIFPSSTYGYYNLSEAYRLAGQKKEALEFLKQYIEKEPEDKDAKLKFEKLIK